MATYNGIKKIKIGDNIFNLYDSGNSGGTITSVKTTAGTHTTINVTSGAANFNVPTKTSHLTNDSGYLTSHQTIKQDGITGATINRYGTCSTAAGTAAKTVNITNGTFSLETGAKVTVFFSNKNTAAAPTLNVNSTGAKNIVYYDAQNGRINAAPWQLYGLVELVYDGTYYEIISTTSPLLLTTYTTINGGYIPIMPSEKGGYVDYNANLTISGGKLSHDALPTATTDQIGGVKLGYTTSGNNRAVQIDSNGNLYVTQKDDNSDTKNTAGSTDTSSKIFLIGATSQAANPQTYSHDTAYVGTDGCLYSGGAKVLTAHQTAVTSLTTTAGSHTTKSSATGAVSIAIPTKTSHLTNDSGFITTYTDTKNTAGSSNTSSKIYLIGATSQAANPQTYSHDTAYVNTNGSVYSEDMTTSNITTFVNNLEVTGGNAAADLVVEQGLSGIWTYRKWNSGIAECWGTYTTTLSHYYGPASGFYGYNSGTVNFPSNLFSAAPTAVVDGKIGTGFYLGSLVTTSTTSVQAIALSTSSGSVSCTFHFIVKGFWK